MKPPAEPEIEEYADPYRVGALVRYYPCLSWEAFLAMPVEISRDGRVWTRQGWQPVLKTARYHSLAPVPGKERSREAA